MRLAIPVERKSLESKISHVFGRTPYFLVYNTETKEKIYIDNEATLSQGGAGVKAAQTIVDNYVDVLICERLGENAAEVIKSANIEIYKTGYDLVIDNLIAYNDKKLIPLEDIHSGYHNHGSK